ncbi:MAG TPA: methyltransferase, TIGR04325 family [Opitutaceae bacterium]
MSPVLTAVFRRLVPKPCRRWLRQTFGWRWFHGDFGTWAEARSAARGYDDGANVARAVAAARSVRRGEAAWERDGTLFAVGEHHRPLVEALQECLRGRGSLDVVDVGGALGSTWWQHRAAFLGHRVRWRIVEQPSYVDAGQREFADDVLSFHARLDEALGNTAEQTALLSCVLSYVEHPHAMLSSVTGAGFGHIILDRTPFITGNRDKLVVQQTPPALGGGSYPCWLFVRENVMRHFQSHYDLVGEWPGFDDPAAGVEYRGLWFRKKEMR